MMLIYIDIKYLHNYIKFSKLQKRKLQAILNDIWINHS